MDFDQFILKESDYIDFIAKKEKIDRYFQSRALEFIRRMARVMERWDDGSVSDTLEYWREIIACDNNWVINYTESEKNKAIFNNGDFRLTIPMKFVFCTDIFRIPEGLK